MSQPSSVVSSVTIDVRSLARTLLYVLGATAIALALASYAGQLMRFVGGHDYVYGLVPLFDVDNEDSIPTVFSAAQLLLAFGILGFICALRITGSSPWTWRVLTVGFLLMAIDELISMHERMTITETSAPGAIVLYERVWVYPAIPVVILGALAFIPFLRSLPRATRNGMLLAGGMFISGSVIVEAFEMAFVLYNDARNTLAFNTFTTVEELLEMLGISVFIYVLVRYVGLHFPTISLPVASTPKPATTTTEVTPLPSDKRIPTAAAS
jgi:hypothetical protein